MEINVTLRYWFIAIALIFIFVLAAVPKTNCEVCILNHNGEKINGYEAFNIFEKECISYESPYSEKKETFYVNLDDINISENGSLSWDSKDELNNLTGGGK